MEKSKGKGVGSYVCNPFSLKMNSQSLGSKGKPTANEYSWSKSGKKPA